MVRIFALSNDVNRYQYFLVRDEADVGKLSMDCTPRASTWAPPPVIVYKPKHLAGDFFHFLSGIIITNERATEQLYIYMSNAGELLPLLYGGRTYTLLNVLNCVECLDEAKTQWRSGVVGGVRMRVPKEPLIFDASAFSDSMIFKVAGIRTQIYVVEGFRDPHQEFKYLVEAAGLQGLQFRRVWDTGENN